LNDPNLPSDVKNRVERILNGCKGHSAGSYSDSPGIEVIRRDVADYIKNRDGGIESDWQKIILCAGASEGIRAVMKMLNHVGSDGKKPGVMIPIPQYPLYTASIAEFDMVPINYYMDESNNWSLDIKGILFSIYTRIDHFRWGNIFGTGFDLNWVFSSGRS
jgi:alanine transaminase